jgi:hypothetical protein
LGKGERARQALGVEGGAGLVIKQPSRVRPGLRRSPLKIGQLPDATAGALPRISKGQGRTGPQLAEEAVAFRIGSQKVLDGVLRLPGTRGRVDEQA